jgi:hypothetical protein
VAAKQRLGKTLQQFVALFNVGVMKGSASSDLRAG